MAFGGVGGFGGLLCRGLALGRLWVRAQAETEKQRSVGLPGDSNIPYLRNIP